MMIVTVMIIIIIIIDIWYSTHSTFLKALYEVLQIKKVNCFPTSMYRIMSNSNMYGSCRKCQCLLLPGLTLLGHCSSHTACTWGRRSGHGPIGWVCSKHSFLVLTSKLHTAVRRAGVLCRPTHTHNTAVMELGLLGLYTGTWYIVKLALISEPVWQCHKYKYQKSKWLTFGINTI